MPDPGLHFAQPAWLWGLLLIPLVLGWLAKSSPLWRRGRENEYADAHLLPHLTGLASMETIRNRLPLLGWVIAWSLLLLAMAGPRWGYRQINPFEPGVDMVILLDISRSMSVMDVAPSRLERARQEIHDLVKAKRGVRIGLIAFSTIAHVVTPITDDAGSLLRPLPALSPDLVRLQGSRIAEALERAEKLLATQGDDVAHNILLISDGDFLDDGVDELVSKLYENGTRFHVLATGSEGGGLVPDVVDPAGEPIVSRLNESGLRGLVKSGGGVYRVADYRDDDTGDILDVVMRQANARQNRKLNTRIWNEYFYWFIVPAALILLALFRPGGNLSRYGQRGGA